MMILRTFVDTGLRKPQGCSCYYLVLCARGTPEDLQEIWKICGQMEALKGALLHKRAELYIQEFGVWQLERNHRFVPSSVVPADSKLKSRLRAAAVFENALLGVVNYVKKSVWEHPVMQKYLNRNLQSGLEADPEFVELESWFFRNETLTPLRTEWSIYDHDYVVAGQIDSLWMDTDGQVEIVMVDWKHLRNLVLVDWKRSRKTLDPDPESQEREAFGIRGRDVGPLDCEYRGACADMYDCAYNHYNVQQHLYSHILNKHYDICVERLLLVHCFPGGPCSTVELEYSDTLAERVLTAFHGGWKKLAGL